MQECGVTHSAPDGLQLWRKGLRKQKSESKWAVRWSAACRQAQGRQVLPHDGFD